mgnify:CR=1 FL=1
MKTRRTGGIAELAVAKKLTEIGFTVSWPLLEDAYDLIAEKGGAMHRIQVKSATLSKHSSYRCCLEHSAGSNPDGVRVKKGYNKKDCDFIILYLSFAKDYQDLIEDGFYIIPVEATRGCYVAVVFPAGKGTGNIKVCKWEKYKDGWEKIQ